MTTVGYGEYTPDDGTGRLFAMMAAFAAMLLLAMASALLAKFVELKYNESVTSTTLNAVLTHQISGWHRMVMETRRK